VTGGPSLSLFEVNQAAAIIKETAHPPGNGGDECQDLRLHIVLRRGKDDGLVVEGPGQLFGQINLILLGQRLTVTVGSLEIIGVGLDIE